MNINQKKILFYLPSFQAGGAERQAFNLALEFKKNYNFNVVIAAQYGGGPIEELCTKHEIKKQVLPFNFYYLKFSKINIFSISHIKSHLKYLKIKNNYLSIIKNINPNYILSYCYEPNVIAGYFKEYYKNTQVIWNQRDTGKPVFLKTIFESNAIKSAVKIVGNSNNSINYLLSHYNVQSKCSVIYNGIQLIDTFPIQKKTIALNENDFVIGMVANYAIGKNYETLIKAFAMIKDSSVKLMLIGRFDEYTKKKLEVIANGKSIIFHYENENIVKALKVCNIIVHASLSEGMPNAILEAMWCKKLVIASNIEAHREVLGPTYPFLFDSTNAFGLMQMILIVKSETQLVNKIIDLNHNLIAQNYSVKNLASTYFNLIND